MTRPTTPYVDFRVGLPVRVRQALTLLGRRRLDAVLDVGCADSAFLAALPRSCRKVGVDLVPNQFRPPDICFVQADVLNQRLPFDDESFDAVYAGEIIEHVLDTERFLQDVRGVLKPGGVLILTTPNLCSIRNLYHWLRRQQLAWVDYRAGQLGHVRYFSPVSMRMLLEEIGFSVVRICSSGFEVGAHVPSLAWVTPLTQWLFAHSTRGNCLIVVAEKAGPAGVTERAEQVSGAHPACSS